MLKRALLALCSFLVVGLVLALPIELALRIRQARLREVYRNENPDLRDLQVQAAADPRLLYTMVPGRGEVNRHGFRDVEHDLVKPDGVYRVVVVGDSIAMGYGVALEETLGRRLEACLRDEGLRAEVITLAVSGYSASQELVLLEEEGFRYQPDLVLWTYGLNDAAHPVYHNANGRMGEYFYRPRSYALHELTKRLFYLRELWKARHQDGEYHRMLNTVYHDAVRDIFAEAKRATEAHGAVLHVVMVPVFEINWDLVNSDPPKTIDDYPVRTFADYGLDDVHRLLVGSLSELGIGVTDIVDAWRSYEVHDLRLKAHDPWHPNARGHRLLAEASCRAVLAHHPHGRAPLPPPAPGADGRP